MVDSFEDQKLNITAKLSFQADILQQTQAHLVIVLLQYLLALASTSSVQRVLIEPFDIVREREPLVRVIGESVSRTKCRWSRCCLTINDDHTSEPQNEFLQKTVVVRQ